MIERLEATIEKYNNLQEEWTKPEVLSDIKLTRQYSKEMSELEDIVNCYKKVFNNWSTHSFFPIFISVFKT